MQDIRSILARFPDRELEIWRRCASDAHFRSVCLDYEEATVALRRWRRAGEKNDRRIEEYTDFIAELETEILSFLDRAATSPSGPSGRG